MLLRLSTLLGVVFAGIAWSVSEFVGVDASPSTKGYLLVGGFVIGFGVVFLGHVAWHYREARTSS